MSLESVAARYAQALYELGVEQNNLPQISADMRLISETYTGNDELRAVLDNPQVDHPSREAILSEVLTRLGISPIVTNTVRLLSNRHRLAVVPTLSRALDTLANERAGIVRATVTTATALPEAYFTQLKAQLETSLGKRVQLERQIDPSLLGGVVTRIGDRVIDGSLRTRLQRMRQTLLTGQ